MLTFSATLGAFPHLLPRRALGVQETGGRHFDPRCLKTDSQGPMTASSLLFPPGFRSKPEVDSSKLIDAARSKQGSIDGRPETLVEVASQTGQDRRGAKEVKDNFTALP